MDQIAAEMHIIKCTKESLAFYGDMEKFGGTATLVLIP